MSDDKCKHSNHAGACYICWHELSEERDSLRAELDALLAEVSRCKTQSIRDICNAYESGVGHRGRPTALINPYPLHSVEAFAYSLGANGIDAAIAKHKEGRSNG